MFFLDPSFATDENTMNKFKTTTVKLLDRVLPTGVKNSLFHLSFHIALDEFRRYAYDYSFAPNMEFGLAAMAGRGFAPKTIVDVGAFFGDWSRIAKRIWPQCKLVMVEPNKANQERLAGLAKKFNARLYCELLGAEDGREVQFHVMGSGSSIMAERSALRRSVESRRLRRLDSLVGELEQPVLLKIDAQGYELEILKGASGLLPAMEAVLLEISTIEINEGAPLLHDVIAFMKSRGFITYDILGIHRRPLDRALNQVDVIFIREHSNLIADKRHFA